MHPVDLQAAVTNTRDFEAAELEANYAQAVNLVLNRLSELNFKLKQFRITNCLEIQSCLLLSANQLWQQEMCICHYCVFNSKISIKCRNISTKLHIYDTATNLSAANLSANSTHHLLPAAPTHLSAATNSNTATELISKWNSKAKTDTTKLEIVDSAQPSGSRQWNLGTGSTQNPNFQHYLSLLVTPEDTTFYNSEFNRQPVLTSNILPATITNNKTLAIIFPFELKETTMVPLFIDNYFIKLILDSGSAGSIITKQLIDQLATKTPIGEIDNFSFKVNGIITSINILVMEATQYQALTDNDKNELTPNWKWKEKNDKGKGKEKKEETTTTNITSSNSYTYPILLQSTYYQPKLICINCSKKLSSIGACCGDNKKYATVTKFYCCTCIIERFGQPKKQGK
ncbi:hypothetical protein G9A89_017104 [Geosiphon pyriformis]|nr:hypothetical protein G9A89_017104 [Geosiphon pyriformis]